jgi:hypothetical protein
MSVADSPLSERILARDPRAIARAISLIEDEAPEAARLIGAIYPHTGRAYLVGVTGRRRRQEHAGRSSRPRVPKGGQTVGILAVDPTSPYSGGAILGDRVRMQSHAEDAGVFIRSMATRGNLGGLAGTTAEAAIVMDAAGFDVIIIETVGVGRTKSTSSVPPTFRWSPSCRHGRRSAGPQGRHHGNRGHLRRQQGRSRRRGSHGRVDRSACSRSRCGTTRGGRR